MLRVLWKNATKKKAYEKLSLTSGQRTEADGLIASLGAEPRPDGCKKMSGKWKDHYRILIGADFRLIYRIAESEVVLVDAGDRKDVYK